MRILFLSKSKPFSIDAAELIKRHCDSYEIVFGHRDDPFPRHVLEKEFDYCFSYISPWIVPKKVLNNVHMASINFHPGPPEYPGIGCTNFAMYNNEKTYGVTAHHMVEQVDAGNIIDVQRFAIFENDSVYTLTQRCYVYIFIMFTRIFFDIVSGRPLPQSQEVWGRAPYTRKELNDLCRVTDDMSQAEIRRRIKATEYPNMPGAYRESDGRPVTLDEYDEIEKR